jgi:hypothetical protein
MTGRGTLPPATDGDRDALPLASPTGLGIMGGGGLPVAESVIGWRFEVLAPAAMNRAERRKPLSYDRGTAGGRRLCTRLPFSRFSNGGLSEPAACRPGPYAGNGLGGSLYNSRSHEAPDPACQCGYRLVEDVDDLQDYYDLAERRHADVLGALALCRMQGFGRVIHGPAPMSDDPPGTSRASHLRLVGPIYLPDDRTGRAADRHLDRFRPRPDVWYVDDPRDLWTADLEHHLTDA